MTINELLSALNVSGDDLLAIYDKEAAAGVEPTQKIKVSDFITSIITLGTILKQSDVVNSLNNPSTTTIPSSAAVANIIGANNAGFHNSIYRGKNLGTSVTAAQWAAISAGTFDDMFIGDYWVINGVDWVIVGFDIRYNIGNTALTVHHVGVMPRASLYSTKWNATDNTVTGGVNGGAGYVYSSIRANIKSSTNGSAEGAELKVIAAFGSTHVLSFRELYPSNYDSNGNATGWAWVDAKTELLSEVDVYGCLAWSVVGKGYEVGADKSQLPIFRLRPDFANIRAYWWLRSVASAVAAADVNYGGGVGYDGASNSLGVRPLSLIA